MSRLMSVVGVALLVVTLCLASAPAVAQTVLISNLDGNDGTQSFNLNDTRNKGMGFTMPAGQDYILDYVTLRLETTGPNTSPIVEIWTDSGGNPGAVIETLTNPAFAPSGIANYDFTSAGTTLTAGTTYWVVAYGVAGADGYSWKANSPAVTPTGLATHVRATFDTDGPPPTSTSSILCSYSLTATLVPVELQSFTIE